MEYTTLGRTGLRVSVAGLGCGGSSRLGQAQGASVEHSVRLVREALDLGVTFIDTALAYGTEAIVGEAISGRRDSLVISTKTPVIRDGSNLLSADFCSGEEIVRRLESSLKKLGADTIDIYHLHGVTPEQYPHCRDAFVPVLRDLKQAGKIRFLGITERFISDTSHVMLDAALDDDCFDVVMAGFNLLNPSARRSVLKKTRAKGVGVLDMFAVRRALSDAAALKETLKIAIEAGQVDGGALRSDPLGFLTATGAAASLQEAAYRFCRHEPSIDVVLTGTGSPAHLRENVASILKGPLPRASLERLAALFGGVDCISGN